MFGAVDEGVAAYGVLTHRHRPEMEQGLAALGSSEPTVIFTPHLVPMQRGILSTCYAPLKPGVDAADITLGGTPQTGTITNDDAATLTLAGVTATQNEGNVGATTVFEYSVTLDQAVQGGFDVAYTTSNGSATA